MKHLPYTVNKIDSGKMTVLHHLCGMKIFRILAIFVTPLNPPTVLAPTVLAPMVLAPMVLAPVLLAPIVLAPIVLPDLTDA